MSRALSRAGASVVLACRDRAKAKEAVDHLKKDTDNSDVRTIPLDLASLESVSEFSKEFRGSFSSLDGIACNAGLWVSMSEGRRTKDGHEIHFGTNHLGHYLLIDLLKPLLSKDARVVMVSSELMLQGQLDMDERDFVEHGR